MCWAVVDWLQDLDDEPSTWAVTSVPDVRSADWQSGDVLVIACDGLFDVCDNAHVAKFVGKFGFSMFIFFASSYFLLKFSFEFCQCLFGR